MRIETQISTTETARQNENFKDLDLNFLAHPSTGDVPKLKGINAIKRAIRNLIYLRKGEIGFSPKKGSGIYHAMFQPLSPAIMQLISTEIYEMLQAFEPRVSVFNVNIADDGTRNGINIDIQFDIENYNEPASLNVFLERIR